jgi:hypothetical protein
VRAHEKGDYSSAIKWYARSLNLGEDKAWCWQNMASAYHEVNDQIHYRETLELLRAVDAKAANEVDGSGRGEERVTVRIPVKTRARSAFNSKTLPGLLLKQTQSAVPSPSHISVLETSSNGFSVQVGKQRRVVPAHPLRQSYRVFSFVSSSALTYGFLPTGIRGPAVASV